jgi:hypothetical protein
MVPLVAERSLWQTPQAASLIITSPRCGGSTLTVSTTTGLPISRLMTARACCIMLAAPGRGSFLVPDQLLRGGEQRAVGAPDMAVVVEVAVAEGLGLGHGEQGCGALAGQGFLAGNGNRC